MISIRTTFCFAFLLILIQTTRAQGPVSANSGTSIYGSAALTNYVFFNNGNSTAKSDGGGVMAGAFYNFPIQSRLTAGIDARFIGSPGSRGGLSAAAALRIGFVPDRVRLRPYFQIGGGVVSSVQMNGISLGQINGVTVTSLLAQSHRYTNGAVEFAGGLDVRLNDSLDLRVFELGAAADGSTNKTVAGSAFVDVGVVYHLQKRQGKS